MTSPVVGQAVGALAVRTITAEEHLALIRSVTAQDGGSASFLQTPAWAAVKPEWTAESIGWVAGDEVVGAALVLYRQLPQVKRYLAYLPEGPVVDWSSDDLAAWLDPMAAHLKSKGAFGIRIGPPVVTRRWSAAQVKEGIADDAVHSLTSVPPDRARARSGPASSPSCARPAGGRSRWPAGSRPGSRSTTSRSRSSTPTGTRAPRTTSYGHEPAVAPQHQEGRQGRRRGRARQPAPT